MTIKINRQSERGGPGLRLLAVCGNDFGIRRLGGKTTFAVHSPSRVLVLTIPPAPVKIGTQTGGAASTQGCANRDIRPSVAPVHLTRPGVVISACQMTHHHDSPKARQQTPASKAQDLVAASRESICLNWFPGSDRNRATAGCRRCHLVEDLGGFVERWNKGIVVSQEEEQISWSRILVKQNMTRHTWFLPVFSPSMRIALAQNCGGWQTGLDGNCLLPAVHGYDCYRQHPLSIWQSRHPSIFP